MGKARESQLTIESWDFSRKLRDLLLNNKDIKGNVNNLGVNCGRVNPSSHSLGSVYFLFCSIKHT